jgi:hypothetical protein
LTLMKIDYAARARALVGTRFRAQGRDEHGLDCVGVALAAFAIPPDAVRSDYRLPGDHARELREQLQARFRRIAKSQLRAGDVMLLAVGEGQLHLGVRTQAGFVHAHAGLRRVVETPGLPEWPIIGVYRKRTRA